MINLFIWFSLIGFLSAMFDVEDDVLNIVDVEYDLKRHEELKKSLLMIKVEIEDPEILHQVYEDRFKNQGED